MTAQKTWQIVRMFLLVGSSLLFACSPSDLRPIFGERNDPPATPQGEPIHEQSEGPRASQPLGTPGVPISNLASIIKSLNLAGLHTRAKLNQNKQVKVAIFDNGYSGIEESVGRRLPPGITILPAPVNNPQVTEHGLVMAETVYAVATGSAIFDSTMTGPQLYLFNTNGYGNLSAAIDQAIALQVDIILYSQVWEFGGNLDGTGFINKLFTRAAQANILCINAVGNYGLGTYVDTVQINSTTGDVKLPTENRYLLFAVPQDGTPVKVTLGWNDFTDDPNYKTRQDLNLYLETKDGQAIEKSELIQDGGQHPLGQGYSDHARESLEVTLRAGEYRLRVNAASRNFTGQSIFWLAVGGEDVTVLSPSPLKRVLIPADNPNVLTVGGTDIPFNSQVRWANGAGKPEVAVNSLIQYDVYHAYQGSSTAAAIVAGALAVYESQNGSLNLQAARGLIAQLRSLQSNAQNAGGIVDYLPWVPHLRFVE